MTHSSCSASTGATALAAVMLFCVGAVQADTSANHRAEQPRPIEMGTSIGVDHLVTINGSLYCTGGTAGAVLVGNGGKRYILSNNHVLADEGNETPGVDGAVQPATLDQCTMQAATGAALAADRVALLDDFLDIAVDGSSNRVDAAIASDLDNCNNGPCLDPNGRILDIGAIDPIPVAPALGMKVTKSGRTTGHSYGNIEAVAVTINVQYDAGVATFVDQMRIRSCAKKHEFGGPGDSGSLILYDTRSDGNQVDAPQPVGLLFAGGRFDIFANDISDVLGELNTKTGHNLGFASCNAPADCGTYYEDRALSVCPSNTDDGGGGGGKKGGGGGGRPNNRGADDATGLDRAQQVANQNAQAILATAGVVGFGIGADAAGNAVIEIYVDGPGAGRGIPAQLGGVNTRIVETGLIYAF